MELIARRESIGRRSHGRVLSLKHREGAATQRGSGWNHREHLGIEIGQGRRIRYIDTPHTPHGWDAGVIFEEKTATLMCGDLFTQVGDGPALIREDIVGPAIAGEDMFNYSSLSPGMGATLRELARLSPRTLALMHGPSFEGDGGAALRALADDYDRRGSTRRLVVA